MLLGVNADESLAELARVQAERRLTWRSFWDGPGGPIAERWGVQFLPTVFVIDSRGTIRYRFDGAPSSAELDGAIEKLLAEISPAPAK